MIGAGAGKLRTVLAQSLALGQDPLQPQYSMGAMGATSEPQASGRAADFTVRIAPMMVELAPQVVVSTIDYNNQVPSRAPHEF